MRSLLLASALVSVGSASPSHAQVEASAPLNARSMLAPGLDAPAPAGAVPSGAAAAVARPDVVPGRIVVKYAHGFDGCPHCLLARGASFATATGGPSLDRLHARLGVRAARPVFFDRHAAAAKRSAPASFERHVDDVRARFPHRAARVRPGTVTPDLSGVFELEISEDVDPELAARLYARAEGVVYASPVRRVQVEVIPNDPYLSSSGSWGQSYADLWGLHAIDAPGAWDVSRGAGAVVAVVDTGVDPSHPDLANLWTNPLEIAGNGVDDDANGYVDDVHGWNFRNRNADTLDKNGHGTHVAATAAGRGADGYGVAGVAYEASIMALKGLSDAGWGDDRGLAEAIVYAADNGADVINNSWGGFGLATPVFDAIAYAESLGVVVVSAAGNDGREITDLLWLPAAHPDGLTVGAIAFNETFASFSNFGPFQSVAAPGVDVLSARSQANVFDNDLDVGARWVRLTGTSMATPHAAGAAAVLLASDPSLAASEARWQLELNARQPAGYEGEIHNPLYGYGILDAAAMFAPAPVTTRLTPPSHVDWHSFQGPGVIPGRPAAVRFTTLAPPSWSLVAPAPLVALAETGVGDATLDLTIDASGFAPGSYAADVVLDAPAAVDGGAAFEARVHVHAEHRAGSLLTLGSEAFGALIGRKPAVASGDVAALAAWQDWSGLDPLKAAIVGGGGVLAGPLTVPSDFHYYLHAGGDGHSFILVWQTYGYDPTLPYEAETIWFTRIGPDGTLFDSAPVRVFSRRAMSCNGAKIAGVAHDGESYWLAYAIEKLCGASKDQFYMVRIHADGSFSRPQRVLKLATGTSPVFECRPGACMWVWWDHEIEGTETDTGKYIRSAYAMPVSDGEPQSAPQKIVTDVFGLPGIATDGQDYLAVGRREHYCGFAELCRTEVVGVRIDGSSGAPLDPDVVVLSNVPAGQAALPWTAGGVTHDGQAYVVSLQVPASDDSPFEDGNYVFANRIGSTGPPSATEHVGFLVDAEGRASQSLVATNATGAVVVWEDGRHDPLVEPYPHPDFTDHVAQRVFEHPPAAGFPVVEIGSIGALSVAERERVRFRVSAPALDPQTVAYSATGLPAGAVFDPATQLFDWRPTGTDSGLDPIVTFAADDGTGSVSEAVGLDVTEAVSTLGGVVQGAASPASGIVLEIRGTADRHRYVGTGSDGVFRLEGVSPGTKLKVRPSKIARKQYRFEPKALKVVTGAGDTSLPPITATPR